MGITESILPDPPIQDVTGRRRVFEGHLAERLPAYVTFVILHGFSREDAEDIVLETSSAVYDNWIRGRPETKEHMSPYFLTALRHKMAEHHRHGERHVRRANKLAEPIHVGYDPDDPHSLAAVDVKRAKDHAEEEAATAALEDLKHQVRRAVSCIDFSATERRVIAVMASKHDVRTACAKHGIGHTNFYRLKSQVIAKLMAWLADHP